MALDINGYNATFRTFVEFAQKTQRDGYDSACANATLAGKRITVSALSLHETSYILRKTGEKTVNYYMKATDASSSSAASASTLSGARAEGPS